MLTAFITGVAGQDGSYLAPLLLENGYRVVGLARRRGTGLPVEANLAGFIEHPHFRLVRGDITDGTLITRLVHDLQPHEYYNLASLSHVGHSFVQPSVTMDTNATAVVTALEAIRTLSPSTRFYQASTSEIFGSAPCPETGHTLASPLMPRSPYGVAKAAAHLAVRNYREAYELYAVSGVLFNHSSPRRGLDFATRVITRGVADVKKRRAEAVRMGDLSAFRDEGWAEDFVAAMWSMLRRDEPRDFIVGTGTGATIEHMLRYACELVDLPFEEVYELDLARMRPSDVPFLKADITETTEALRWVPSRDWRGVIEGMLERDLSR